jgi:hypothetical protein
MSSTKNDADDANADNTVFATNGGVPPPMIIVDPLSFPRTDDGLKKLLSIVDADYPFLTLINACTVATAVIVILVFLGGWVLTRGANMQKVGNRAEPKGNLSLNESHMTIFQ